MKRSVSPGGYVHASPIFNNCPIRSGNLQFIGQGFKGNISGLNLSGCTVRQTVGKNWKKKRKRKKVETNLIMIKIC
jgi:hypothetical protein